MLRTLTIMLTWWWCVGASVFSSFFHVVSVFFFTCSIFLVFFYRWSNCIFVHVIFPSRSPFDGKYWPLGIAIIVNILVDLWVHWFVCVGGLIRADS